MEQSCCGGDVPSPVGEGEQSCDPVRCDDEYVIHQHDIDVDDIYYGDDDHRGLPELHPRGEDTVWVFEPDDDVSVSTESSGDLLSVDCPGWDGFRAAATPGHIHVFRAWSVVCVLCGGVRHYDDLHHHHGPGDNDVLIHQHDGPTGHKHDLHAVNDDYESCFHFYGPAVYPTHNDTAHGAAEDGGV